MLKPLKSSKDFRTLIRQEAWEAEEYERTFGSIRACTTEPMLSRQQALGRIRPYIVPFRDRGISTTAFSTHYSYGEVPF
jgi:hypothetical protein